MASQQIPVGEILGATDIEVVSAVKMMKLLLNIAYENLKNGAISEWSKNILSKLPGHRYTLPLGIFEGVEHWIAIESLGPRSLNCADERVGYTHRDTLVDAVFMSPDGQKDERRAIPVGRIIAARDGFSAVFQSHWVVLYDSTGSLWACHAKEVAPYEEEPLRPGVQTRRYYQDPALDNIFNANWSAGENVIFLGHLNIMFFQMTTIRSIEVSSATWNTYTAKVLNNGDFGHPIHAIGFQRLRAVNILNIKKPQYRGNRNFVYLADIVGYSGFRADLNNTNRPLVLDRQTTEAAWLSVLIGKYVKYDAAQLSARYPGKEMIQKKRMLFMALVQRSGVSHFRRNLDKPELVTSSDNVEAYWKKREKLSPGLDIAWIEDDKMTTGLEAPEEDVVMDEDMREHLVSEDEQILLVERPLLVQEEEL
ncbi:hypothetical protein WAI453_009953 [Rhynchosporium graminicola]